MKQITYERLAFLETRELWVLLRDLNIPYCTIKDVEKENLTTHEKTLVPQFTPRTDFEEMKSDIMMAIQSLGRAERRNITCKINKMISKREKEYAEAHNSEEPVSEGEDNG